MCRRDNRGVRDVELVVMFWNWIELDQQYDMPSGEILQGKLVICWRDIAREVSDLLVKSHFTVCTVIYLFL